MIRWFFLWCEGCLPGISKTMHVGLPEMKGSGFSKLFQYFPRRMGE